MVCLHGIGTKMYFKYTLGTDLYQAGPIFQAFFKIFV